MIQELHLVLIEKDVGMLATMLTIIAPQSDAIVIGQLAQQVLALRLEHLLSTKDVGMLKENLTADDGQALLPAIAGISITLVLITNVVTAHVERLGLRTECCCHHHGAQHEFSK